MSSLLDTTEAAVLAERRTHCDCGAEMPSEPTPYTGDWGDWQCPKGCGRSYCQDCGGDLDYNDECLRYQGLD
jgi:hypothetical protein